MRDALDLLTRATGARRHGQLDDDAERRLEQAFGCSRRLAAYGTLAPGEANHDRVSGCPGTWWRGTVTGRRAMRDHPVFTFDPAAPPVPVAVLSSEQLAAHWPQLDEFEGDDYCRILVPIARTDGSFTIGNLYEVVVPVVG